MKENEPTFRSIFGDAWETMPPVMHKHYANRPFSNDTSVVEGKMDVTLGRFAKLFAPLFKLFGILVPYEGRNIPTTVIFRSEEGSDVFIFDRIFHFPNKKPWSFYSRMTPQGGNEVIEYMKLGIGWRAYYSYEDGKVLLRQGGYVWKLLGVKIPIPMEFLFGKGYAEETPLTDSSFKMLMHITHPLWGKVYEYKGTFEVKE